MEVASAALLSEDSKISADQKGKSINSPRHLVKKDRTRSHSGGHLGMTPSRNVDPLLKQRLDRACLKAKQANMGLLREIRKGLSQISDFNVLRATRKEAECIFIHVHKNFQPTLGRSLNDFKRSIRVQKKPNWSELRRYRELMFPNYRIMVLQRQIPDMLLRCYRMATSTVSGGRPALESGDYSFVSSRICALFVVS